ncbi:hypothetical protein MKW92_003254 [Papaver armeniacum]|nr:hypothetical protein MKW92_003254 [Papaver armeniacum]
MFRWGLLQVIGPLSLRMSSKKESKKAMKRNQRTKRNAQSFILLGGVPSANKCYLLSKLPMRSEKRKELTAHMILVLDGLVDVFGPYKGKRSLRGFSSVSFAKRAKQAFPTAALRDSTVMAQNISSDHPTSEETILDDSCTPNSEFTPDFTPENHAFTRNLDPMSEPQPFENSGYEESSYQNVNLLDRMEK